MSNVPAQPELQEMLNKFYGLYSQTMQEGVDNRRQAQMMATLKARVDEFEVQDVEDVRLKLSFYTFLLSYLDHDPVKIDVVSQRIKNLFEAYHTLMTHTGHE